MRLWMLAVLGVAPLLASCEARARATPTAPQLWRAEALAPDGSVAGAVRVCADIRVWEGLRRPLPAAGNAICLREANSYRAHAGGFTERCELNGARYRLDVGLSGDINREFSVDMRMTALDTRGKSVAQVRRYRLLGACPPGWKIGDSDKPGEGRRPNAYS